MRTFAWIVLNGGVASFAWLAIMEDSEGAGRLLIFISWLFGLLDFLGAFNDEVCRSAQARGRSVPEWVAVIYAVALIGFLVWHGWFWTSIALFLGVLGEFVAYNRHIEEVTA